MRVAEVPFVVVDVETTGTKAGADRVIEVGAVRVQGGEITGRFAHLVDPERSVPRRITELTGITTGMVFGQSTAAEVMPALVEFLGDGVFVAHHLAFDLCMVNAELARLGRPPLANPALCTLRLARRLLRGLRSKGLASLTDHYQIPNKARHRALGDAEATALVLERLLRQLAFEYDVTDLDALLVFQHKKYADLRRVPKHLQQIRRDVLPRLPERPGVYFMKDQQGGILYIGKAKRLRTRVRSYFTGIEGHPARTQHLVETVRAVEWTETGSELEALLLESRLIKEHKPRFNRAQRRYRNRPFIRLDTTQAFPRVSWTPVIQADGAEYYGPLGGRRQAELVVDVINQCFRLRACDDDLLALGRRCLYGAMGRCLMPCTEEAPAYAVEVQRVRRFLAGEDRSVLERLEQAMRAASAEMKYEQAATYRDWLGQLERLMRRQQCVAAPVRDHNGVLVLPGGGGDGVGLFLVRFGRLVATQTVPGRFAERDVERLRQELGRHFHPEQQPPERYFKREVDEVRLLAHWMYVQRAQTRHVRWHATRDPAAFLDDVLAAIRASGTRQPAIEP